MSRAEYKRQWRARHGAETGKFGPKITKPCGTYAAWRRHQRRKETPCPACTQAHKDYQHQKYLERKAKQQ